MKLDAKAVRIGVKNGMGVTDLCDKYGYTAEVLFDRIHSFYRRNMHQANSIIGQLQDNEARQRARAEAETDTPEVKTEVMSEIVIETIDAKPDDDWRVELAETKKLESTQSRELMAIEAAYRSTVREHCDCLDEFRQIQTALEEIRNTFLDKCAEYEQVATRNNELVRKMQEEWEQKNQKAAELAATRERIVALTKVEIYIYRNGNIEAENVTLDDSGHDAEFQRLMVLDTVAELRARDIKTLARFICIKRNLSQEVVPVFEDEEVAAAYAAVA